MNTTEAPDTTARTSGGSRRARRTTFAVRLDIDQRSELNSLAAGVRRATGKNCSLSDVLRGALNAAARDPRLLGLM